jgi:hypothetical protein
LGLFGFVFYRQNRHSTSVKSGDYCFFNLALFRNFHFFRAEHSPGLVLGASLACRAEALAKAEAWMLVLGAFSFFRHSSLGFRHSCAPILPHPVGQRLSNLKNLSPRRFRPPQFSYAANASGSKRA